MKNENFIQCFSQDYAAGAKLFLNSNKTKKDLDVSIGICSTAQDLRNVAKEAEVYGNMLTVLDDSGRKAIAPLLAARLEEMIFAAKEHVVRYAKDTLESRETSQLRKDVNRFIETLEAARSVAARGLNST